MWDQVGERGCWNPVFISQINDWQLREVEELLRRLQVQVIKRGVEDVMVWRLLKGNIFTIKSFYFSLVVCSMKQFPTLDQLKRRGWCLPNRCYLCKGEEESTNHILLHCPKTIMLWYLIFAILYLCKAEEESLHEETCFRWNPWILNNTHGEKHWPFRF